MTAVVYIHGFLSSPLSHKAKVTQAWLTENRPSWQFHCPQLSSYPQEAIKQLEDVISRLADAPIFFIGSSLGGYWATHFIERGLGSKAVLINPAVSPHTRFGNLVGQELGNYYTDDTYCLSADDLNDLARYNTETIAAHPKYWLMVQTEDETLDYRQAVEKYQGCKQLVEEGGSHTFDGYQNWLPEIIEFFETQNTEQ